MMPSIAGKRSAACAGIGLAGALALSAVGAIGVTAVSATGAAAQGFWSIWDPPPRPRRTVRRPTIPPMTAAEEKAAELSGREKDAQGPLVLNVSLKKQRVIVYDKDGFVTDAPISSGRVGFPTPTGVFTILEKRKIHFSNLYDSAPMPNMQRITWSGVALHAGQLPGYPASHGCIRLPYGFSKKLFGMTKLGTRVIVSRDPITPAPIEHERLFKAYPPESETASLGGPAATMVADASNSTVPVVSDAHLAAAGESTRSAGLPKPTYRERRLAELAALEARIRSAGYKKVETGIAAAQAAKVALVTRNALNKTKLESLRLERIARKASDAKASAEKEIAALTKRIETATRMSARERNKALERRAALEARLPELADEAQKAEADAARAAEAVAAAQIPADVDEAARRAAVEKLNAANNELAAAMAIDQENKRREAKRALPVSVFISRATQRLYIRQGYEPMLEVPVVFEAPDQPVGTHVFTAHDYKGDKTEMVWTVASVPYTAPEKPASKKRKEKGAQADRVPEPAPAAKPLPQTAAAALERVTIPEEVREQISDVMKPGSSLVISDNKLSGETGKYTDFIVSLR